MTCLVLLPGMDGTGELFAPFIAALSESVRPTVIAYPPAQLLGYKQLEVYVRERLPLDEPFVLLGESFSGPIAISIAASPPANLAGLILCCSFARNPRLALAGLKPLIRFLLGLRSSTLSAPLLLTNYATPELIRQLKQALAVVSTDVLRARLRSILEVDVTDAMRRIRVPILCLRAKKDFLVPQSASNLIASLAPQTRVAITEGPHMLLQASPVATAEIVTNFCSAQITTTSDSQPPHPTPPTPKKAPAHQS